VDFENARRGFIAPLNDGGKIKDAAGKDIWNIAAYQSFIKDGTESPNTVNPSLWRMAELLMYSGLFEVVPGVYQVRGADLSNMTIVEGGSGIAIYNPLISAEAARAALELYYQHRPRKPVVAVVYSHSRFRRWAPKLGRRRRRATTRSASSPVILCGQEWGARESSCRPFNFCPS
jgi:alkyl sulfatase BDS1-like metallo-beta-lactamase superfamily hydrolase